jgi:hypothetical protein
MLLLLLVLCAGIIWPPFTPAHKSPNTANKPGFRAGFTKHGNPEGQLQDMEIYGTCLQCFCLLIMFVKARSRLQRLPTVVAITCWGMPGGTPLFEYLRACCLFAVAVSPFTANLNCRLTCFCVDGCCCAAVPTAARTLGLHPHAAAAAQPTGGQEGTQIDIILTLIQQHSSLTAAAAVTAAGGQAGKWADSLLLAEPTGSLQQQGHQCEVYGVRHASGLSTHSTHCLEPHEDCCLMT